MPKSLKEIKHFHSGTVISSSEQDISDDTAAFSLNIDPMKEGGILDGIKNAKGLIYQSKYSKFIINNFYSINPEIPSVIINNGVDLKKFNNEGNNFRENLGINPTDLVFITSANFRSQKRLD